MKIPGALRTHFSHKSKTNWFYKSQCQPQLNGRSITLHSGRLCGGSSSINGMIFILPTSYDLFRWNKTTGVDNWLWKDVEPTISEVTRIVPANIYSNFDYLSEQFIQSAIVSGHRYISDINDLEQERLGVFHYPVNISAGTRWASYRGYLQPAIRYHKRISISPDSFVKRILFKKNKAIGCEYTKNGVTYRAYADREVILSAGVYSSPTILMRSGIGDAQILTQIGIKSIVNNVNVGQHVIDHPEINIQHHCPIKFSLNRYLTSTQKLKEGMKWLLFRRGIAAVNQAFTGAFLSYQDSQHPQYQLHFWPAYFSDRTALPGLGGFKIGINLCYPASVGEIKLNPLNTCSLPEINVGYLNNKDDVKAFTKAFQHTRKILSHSPLANISMGEETPGLKVNSAYQIVEYIYSNVDSGYHSTSSCRMSSTKDMGVVDKNGAVFGVDNLRVIDASILPTVVGCNPAATIMIVAHRLSQFICTQNN